jgi:hypothetical protein
MDEYLLELLPANESTAIWLLITVAAAWGAILGATGILAVQEFIANRRREKDQSR